MYFFVCSCSSNAQMTKYMYAGKRNTEYFTKKNINDSIYIEKDIFRQISSNLKFLKDDKTQSIYILEKKRKKIFFDGYSTNISLNYHNKQFLLYWEESELKTKENYSIYKMTIKPKDVFITHIPTYYFTYENGVIAIEGSEYTLKREDFSYLDL